MNSRHVIILAIVALLAVFAAFWSTSIRDNGGAADAAFLVPGLNENINNVSELRVITPGGNTSATLRKTDRGWIVAERAGYPADAGKLRKSLLELAGARLIERRTSNPELYERLGVEAIAAEGAQGVRIEIDGLEQAVAIIIGNPESGRSATNVRHADAEAAWLVTGALSIEKEPTQWLNKTLLEVPSDRIYTAHIRHPDGGEVRVHQNEPGGGDFVVDNMPAGRELRYSTVANGIGAAITALAMEDLIPASDFEPEGEPVHIEYQTFDGMAIAIDAFAKGLNDRYLKLGLAYDAKVVEELAARHAPASESAASLEETDTAAGAETETVWQPVDPDEIQATNNRLRGWVFKVSNFRYDQLTKTLEDLLSPVPVDD